MGRDPAPAPGPVPDLGTTPERRCPVDNQVDDQERASDKVFVRADGAVSYERVAQLMGALNAGGFNNIGLVTETGGPAFGGGN